MQTNRRCLLAYTQCTVTVDSGCEFDTVRRFFMYVRFVYPQYMLFYTVCWYKNRSEHNILFLPIFWGFFCKQASILNYLTFLTLHDEN